MKYLRVIQGTKSHASGFQFEFDKISVAPLWNPSEKEPEKQGGFNITNEESVLRWMIRGDTLCDVEIPDDAEIIAINNQSTPGGVFRANKIILKNPRPITEWLAIELYRMSNLPEETYFKILTIAGGKGFKKLQDLILAEKVNKNNVERAIKVYTEYSNCMHDYPDCELHKKTIRKLQFMKAKFQNKRIDLHVHTKFSDATHTAEELLDLSKQSNVGVLSVTDHDSVGFYKHIKENNITLPEDLIIIPGIEITCRYDGKMRDILGYNINCDIMDTWLESKYPFIERLAKQKRILINLKILAKRFGLRFDDSVDVYEGKKSEAYVQMYLELSKYPENIILCPELQHISRFHKECFTNPESPLFVDETYDCPSIEGAIQIIHDAGGKAFIAHPYKYRMSDKETMQYIDDVCKFGVDGIEVQHQSNEWNDAKKIYKIAKQYNLLISGGSDFHGDLKPEVKLGKGRNNINIPFDDINNWIVK